MTVKGNGKVALITGVTGQDGAYLSELLLSKGYTVHGVKRRSSSFNTGRLEHIYQDPHVEDPRFVLHYGDMTDSTNLIRIVQQTQPDEIYNLAAQSHVQVSFETPEYTSNADGTGTLRLLEAILADLYGPMRLVADGLIPAKLVYGNPEFLRPVRHDRPDGRAPLAQAPDEVEALVGGNATRDNKQNALSGQAHEEEPLISAARP